MVSFATADALPSSVLLKPSRLYKFGLCDDLSAVYRFRVIELELHVGLSDSSRLANAHVN